jgi:hypothetical protein
MSGSVIYSRVGLGIGADKRDATLVVLGAFHPNVKT